MEPWLSEGGTVLHCNGCNEELRDGQQTFMLDDAVYCSTACLARERESVERVKARAKNERKCYQCRRRLDAEDGQRMQFQGGKILLCEVCVCTWRAGYHAAEHDAKLKD